MSREKAPVFVVGCPRSGTTLVYDILLSSGGFAVYQMESNVFNLLVPRFGDMRVRKNREQLVDAWLQSKLFRATFLDAQQIRARLLAECENGGDFLRIVMGEMARAQGVGRWADNSPEELQCALTIKRYLPNALFIHMIRDGRDVALSLDARPHAWIRPFSWDREDRLAIAGIFWEWAVNRGRRIGRGLGRDYLEVRFEDLQANIPGTLAKIGEFIQHDLDYSRIQRVAIGSVSQPNTSFKGDGGSPVGRWKHKIAHDKLELFEAIVGPTLKDLNYPIATSAARGRLRVWWLRMFYRAYLDAKFWFKYSSLGRACLGRMTGPQIDATTMGIDPAQATVAASQR